MKNFVYTLLAALLLGNASVILGSPIGTDALASVHPVRSTNTCADPAQSDVYIEAFNTPRTLHLLRPLWVIVDNVSSGGNLPVQTPAFCAWQTPQASTATVPLFQLFDPTTNDAVYLISTNGNPPAPPAGFEVQLIVGYVYATQVCGSVPLLAAAQTANSDHWYTTNAREHANLLANGWTDAGVTAFVLPLSNCI